MCTHFFLLKAFTILPNDDFRLYCGQIDALAFLPIDKINEGITFLRDTAPEEALPLLDYFDNTYVTGQLLPRVQRNVLD